jgi:DNA-directed RNA polymerase subunit RPC12/RpoP
MNKQETVLYCDHCKERHSLDMAIMDGTLARCPDCGSLLRNADIAPSECPAIEAALAGIEAALKSHKERPEYTQERGYSAGYTEGLERAISEIRYEIGIRQNPPNISF